MKVPVIAAVLSLCAASGLRAAPFSELWRVTGVTVSDGGYSVTLRWPAAAYQHQFPGYRAIEWKAGADIRLEPEVVISCRVPSFATDGTPLAAELRLPRHPDAKNRQEAEEAVREIAEIASEKGPLVGLIAALAMAGRSERTPVRVGLGGGGAEFNSLLVQYPANPSLASVVEPLEPDWMLSALVSEIEVDMTIDGQRVRAKLRFKPDAGLARAARMMVQHCGQREHRGTGPL